MGCGGSRNNYENTIIRDKDFYLEAFCAQSKTDKGLMIDDNKNIESCKTISDKNPAFMEEILEHADESGSVKPWIVNMVPPEEDLVENKEIPYENLKIEHVFGYRCFDIRHNLFYLDDNHIVYSSGALGIVQNTNDFTQKVFGGLEWDDTGSCHDDVISALTIYRGKIPMIATGQRKNKPAIHVWSPNNPSIVYNSFHLLKGSKEVSRLNFDYKGEYLFAIGRDKLNTIYFFHLETKARVWITKTGENIIFDAAFSPSTSNFCVVGVKTILFGNYLTKTFENPNKIREDLLENTFTVVCYTNSSNCLIGTQTGRILIFQESKYIGEVKAGGTALHILLYNEKYNSIYVSDSDMKMYNFACNFTANPNEILKLREISEVPSIAKSFDINSKDEMVLGLKHGMIILRELKNSTKNIDRIITRSHYFGKIQGLCYVPDKYILTTCEDNRLMLWNIENKTCEARAYLHDRADINAEITSRHSSKTVAYSLRLNHIAIGLNDGEITIRNGLKNPNDRLMNNVKISTKEIEVVRYSPDGSYLGVSAQGGEFFILNTEQNYNVVYKLRGHETPVIQFDWDQTSRYIQAVTQGNDYIYFDVKKEIIVQDPITMRSVNWNNITCKFGYTIQGIFMGSTDPNFINTVALSNSKKLLVSGDDDKCLNIYRYPCYSDNPKIKRFIGHSDQISNVVFTHDDSRIISIAYDDKSIIVWKVIKN